MVKNGKTGGCENGKKGKSARSPKMVKPVGATLPFSRPADSSFIRRMGHSMIGSRVRRPIRRLAGFSESLTFRLIGGLIECVAG